MRIHRAKQCLGYRVTWPNSGLKKVLEMSQPLSEDSEPMVSGWSCPGYTNIDASLAVCGSQKHGSCWWWRVWQFKENTEACSIVSTLQRWLFNSMLFECEWQSFMYCFAYWVKHVLGWPVSKVLMLQALLLPGSNNDGTCTCSHLNFNHCFLVCNRIFVY